LELILDTDDRGERNALDMQFLHTIGRGVFTSFVTFWSLNVDQLISSAEWQKGLAEGLLGPLYHQE
jgi:hypothetical protein